MAEKPGPEAQVREIRRRTRHRYSAEEKIRIVLEGLKGEESIAAEVAGDSLVLAVQADELLWAKIKGCVKS